MQIQSTLYAKLHMKKKIVETDYRKQRRYFQILYRRMYDGSGEYVLITPGTNVPGCYDKSEKFIISINRVSVTISKLLCKLHTRSFYGVAKASFY